MVNTNFCFIYKKQDKKYANYMLLLAIIFKFSAKLHKISLLCKTKYLKTKRFFVFVKSK